MAYRIAAILMALTTLNSFTCCKPYLNVIFHIAVQQLTGTSCSPSAIAVLLDVC